MERKPGTPRVTSWPFKINEGQCGSGKSISPETRPKEEGEIRSGRFGQRILPRARRRTHARWSRQHAARVVISTRSHASATIETTFSHDVSPRARSLGAHAFSSRRNPCTSYTRTRHDRAARLPVVSGRDQRSRACTRSHDGRTRREPFSVKL